MRISCLLIVALAGTATADPAPVPHYVLQPGPLFDPQPAPRPRALPAPLVPSLRIEAARVAAERFQDSWRYPEPGQLASIDGGAWFVGYYRPLTRRSAALHAGSIGATLLGEILLAADSPLAGLGALVTGATLDGAAADSDRDAEARRAVVSAPSRPAP